MAEAALMEHVAFQAMHNNVSFEQRLKAYAAVKTQVV